GRKVKGIIHWVSTTHAVPLEVRLFDRLFDVPDPGAAEDFRAHLNAASLSIVAEAWGEPALAAAAAATFQFERLGYFCRDAVDDAPGRAVFNRTATLRDTWARVRERE
ncbi:MAG: glutamine--tRNA ligase, partial [Gammaproteobacteria bacterium]